MSYTGYLSLEHNKLRLKNTIALFNVPDPKADNFMDEINIESLLECDAFIEPRL
ncbi:MAG: hypothetical protein Ct9H90mP27_3800 [Gammaproteobacteria bacterium]|nr:MAG: hypothetical protein Ct9H90mP27_3800 [Gammaproteobacteria bacterium]